VEHGNLIANGQWSPDEVAKSSAWRELQAVRLVLESFQNKLRNEQIHWFSDNQNVVRIVQCGSKQPHLQSKALSIFATCLKKTSEWSQNGSQGTRMNWLTTIVV